MAGTCRVCITNRNLEKAAEDSHKLSGTYLTFIMIEMLSTVKLATQSVKRKV